MRRNLIFKFIITFLAITGALVLISLSLSDLQFGHSDFWKVRGYLGGGFFLLFMALFPRLTLFFSSVPFGGFLWWMGWLFAPRILVACLATLAYWHQNPFLVVCSWLIALGGESSEKFYLGKKGRSYTSYTSSYTHKPHHHSDEEIPSPETSDKRDAIEAEYKKL